MSGLNGYADRRRLVIGDRAGRIELWDTLTGDRFAVLSESGGGVMRLAWTEDQSLLAVGRESGEVELREISTGRLKQTLLTPAEHTRFGQLESVFFGPGDRALYAVNWSGHLSGVMPYR